MKNGCAPVRVSVVIPCYRASSTIRRATESALTQTWLPDEVIIVDDASDDEATDSELRAMEEQYAPIVTVLRLDKNEGPSGARNHGWSSASGEYIAFLDSDDAWLPDKLEVQLKAMLSNPTALFSAHAISSPGEEGPAWNDAGASFVPLKLERMLLKNRVATSSVILPARSEHRFPETLRYSEDYHLWVFLLADGGEAILLQRVLCHRFNETFGDSGLSSDLTAMESGQSAVYRDLFMSKKISTSQYVIAMVWGKVRFIRRLALTKLRQAK